MRQSWSRIGCALLVAFGVLGFSTSVAATAETGTTVSARASVGALPMVAKTALGDQSSAFLSR